MEKVGREGWLEEVKRKKDNIGFRNLILIQFLLLTFAQRRNWSLVDFFIFFILSQPVRKWKEYRRLEKRKKNSELKFARISRTRPSKRTELDSPTDSLKRRSSLNPQSIHIRLSRSLFPQTMNLLNQPMKWQQNRANRTGLQLEMQEIKCSQSIML